MGGGGGDNCHHLRDYPAGHENFHPTTSSTVYVGDWRVMEFGSTKIISEQLLELSTKISFPEKFSTIMVHVHTKFNVHVDIYIRVC